MDTEYHFEADQNDADADRWQEEQDALAEANAEELADDELANGARWLEMMEL